MSTSEYSARIADIEGRWSLLAGLWRACRHAAERARQRSHLRSMQDWQLHDIGVSREEADCEAGRPWWA